MCMCREHGYRGWSHSGKRVSWNRLRSASSIECTWNLSYLLYCIHRETLPLAAAKQLSVGAKRSMQQLEKKFHSAFCRIQDPFERDLWEIQQWRAGSHHGPFWSWEVDAHEHSGGIQVSRCQQRKLCEGRSHFRTVVPGSILSCTAFATGISAHMDSWETEHMRACVPVCVGGGGCGHAVSRAWESRWEIMQRRQWQKPAPADGCTGHEEEIPGRWTRQLPS